MLRAVRPVREERPIAWAGCELGLAASSAVSSEWWASRAVTLATMSLITDVRRAFLGVVFGGALKRHMPFGPYLAIATVLVWFLKPLIERLLGVIGHLPGPMALP